MTIARGAAAGALALAVVVLAVLLLGGGGNHRYRLLFQNAGQLVRGDDVQVGGRKIGSVKDIELTNDNQAQVTVDIEKDFAPLHQGTSAVIRATSLSGIANRYVALTLGPQNHPKLADGSVITAEHTTTPVDLDQLFNTLDPPTRRDLQRVIQGSARWYQGRGRQANVSARYFSPALSTTSQLATELAGDQRPLTDFLVNSSKLVTALAERRADLADLVTNTNTATAAIGDENVSLGRALELLPTTLRRGNTTFVNLRATLDDLDVLVATSKPATRRLAPFLAQLRPLVASARPTIADLRRLVFTPGRGNDLLDTLRRFPRLQRIASPTFSRAIATLRRAQPVIEFARPYTPELVGWLRDFGQGASSYDANGHYARVQPIFNAFSLNGNVLNPIPSQSKFAGVQTGVFKRCPGAASQPAADGSAPWRDASGTLDCDPRLVLPGP